MHKGHVTGVFHACISSIAVFVGAESVTKSQEEKLFPAQVFEPRKTQFFLSAAVHSGSRVKEEDSSEVVEPLRIVAVDQVFPVRRLTAS